MATLSRRQFLKAGAAGTLTLAFSRLACSRQQPFPEPLKTPAMPAYGDWRDVYRKKWAWDRVVRGTHTASNCVAACAWNLYVRDELVFFEEQSAPYTASNSSLPDFNPRGCQKGACYSDLSYGPARVSYPLERVGPRGEGRWKRISWEEALAQISTELVGALDRRGGEGVICELGGNIDYGPSTTGTMRFFGQMGVPMTASVAQIGDLPIGGTITMGLPFTDGSSDDWFCSDYLVLWAFNPSATRIPDAHYLNEARYRGAKVVSITPDYGPSAIHSDMWLSLRPGTDAALALAACNVVVAEDLYDDAYVREQSDLPFLVRSDTGRFLRESDVVDGGSDEVFALWDESKSEIAWAPGSMGSSEKTLKVADGVRPALEVETDVELASGDRVEVRTVFSLLREGLGSLSPEKAATITGVSAGAIRRFAREFAAAPSALIISQFGICKNYHSDLAQRSQILLASLTGNLGRAGGGWRSGTFVALDGMGLVAMQEKLDILHLLWTAAHSQFDPKAVMGNFVKLFISGTLFHTVHGGLEEFQTSAAHGDPALANGAAPYLKEALAKGHFPIGPPPDADPPEVVVSVFGNVLRHSKMGNRVRDTLFANARLVVDVTFRMSETSRSADILLPAASWYEKIGLKKIPTIVPYVTLGDRAVAPLNEAKGEWEIFSLLARAVAEEARRNNVSTVKSFRGEDLSLDSLDERFSDGGRFGPDGEDDVMAFMLSVSAAVKGIDLETLRREGGAVRLTGLGPQGGTAGVFSEYSQNEPISPLRDFTEKQQPYPTLSFRQEFYIDHPWFLELGEQLPTHKEPPAMGGDHPFTLTSGHTRWSIHSMWRDHELMLRMQRGGPVVLLNDGDAGKRAIGDNDDVRVWNDLGSFQAKAVLTAAIRPGQAHIYHAWESHQFPGGKNHQCLAPSPLKVTQLVGDYGHLRWSYGYYEPNQVDRDTRVDVTRV